MCNNNLKLNNRIRNAETKWYVIILVVGIREVKNINIVIGKRNMHTCVYESMSVLNRETNVLKDIWSSYI